MNISTQHLQGLYLAFTKTKSLWKAAAVLNLEQLDLPIDSSPLWLRKLDRPLRLGQLAEQFVFNQIEASVSLKILAENIQVQQNKQTIGELDALIIKNEQPIHLEIVYKFYVYDASLGDAEIERWIGPNRKDSLSEKLTKLKNKQLPLLYTDASQNLLHTLDLSKYQFKQYVLFKAQLFVPFEQAVIFEDLNEACVCGFYINTAQLKIFANCTFYIPRKLDWFLEPHKAVSWLDFENFSLEAHTFIDNRQSPLFWMKSEIGDLKKCFLVWW
ncbi:DUF1853 family protein [Psychroserpens sp.]|uniref:DUF1853 family protein n=1 Tax=Psychroserpens sp. TaxID=2020870 RepID=UPI003C75E660